LQPLTPRVSGLCNQIFNSLVCAIRSPRVDGLCNFLLATIWNEWLYMHVWYGISMLCTYIRVHYTSTGNQSISTRLVWSFSSSVHSGTSSIFDPPWWRGDRVVWCNGLHIWRGIVGYEAASFWTSFSVACMHHPTQGADRQQLHALTT
jgi:hypothetical protein